MLNQLIANAVDQDIGLLAAEPKKLMKRMDLSLITVKNFILRISRNYNFYTIRLGTEIALQHKDQLKGLIALNKETEKLHQDNLKANGFILGDSKLQIDDPRVTRFVIEEMEIAAKLSSGKIAHIREHCGSRPFKAVWY